MEIDDEEMEVEDEEEEEEPVTVPDSSEVIEEVNPSVLGVLAGPH